MRISDWSSDVCSSDLAAGLLFDSFRQLLRHGCYLPGRASRRDHHIIGNAAFSLKRDRDGFLRLVVVERLEHQFMQGCNRNRVVRWIVGCFGLGQLNSRSEEHTSELQSLMRISYAVFCLTQNITE